MTTPTQSRARAADLRRHARRVLDRHHPRGGNLRLTLILGQALIITFAIGLYLCLSALRNTAALRLDLAALVALPGLPHPASMESLLDVGMSALLILLLITLILPLCASLYRMAILAMAVDIIPACGPADDIAYPTLVDLFYPFTSPRAYARTLAVVLDHLAWLLLIFGLPALILACLDSAFLTSLGILPAIAAILGVLRFLPAAALAVLFFILSGSRAGFGAFVFRYADLPLGEVRRFFRVQRRPLLPVLGLRCGFFGWIVLSFVGAFLPALLHVIPYVLLTTAAYADDLVGV